MSKAAATKSAKAATTNSFLEASYLHNATPGQLLSRLLDVFHVLDDASQLPKEQGFLSEILQKKFLTAHAVSTNPDLSVVVVSILSDVFRLFHVGGNAAAVGLPFPPHHANEVLRLIVSSLGRIRLEGTTKTATPPSPAFILHARHSIERLSLSKALVRILAACSETEDTESLITQLFETLLFHSHVLAPADGDAQGSAINLSRSGQLLSDAIVGTRSLSEAQLSALLSALSLAKRQSCPSAAVVARVVLRRNDASLGPLLATHIHAQAETASEELRRLEVVDGAAPTPESLQEKRNWLKQLSSTFEMMAELATISLPLVEQLVPLLRNYLGLDNADVRMLAVRGFSKLFLNTFSVTASHFRTTFDSFLARFHDIKTMVRIELIRHAQHDLSANLKSEERWALYGPQLEARLADSDESVRRSTIVAVCDLCAAGAQVPTSLMTAVGQRCVDKHPRVRQQACERLCQLYKAIPLPWIPNAVFESIYAEGGVTAIELGLEDMLPSPDAKGGALAPTTTGDAKSSKGGSKAKSPAVAHLFEFELTSGAAGESDPMNETALREAASKRSFVDGLSLFCGDLEPRHWNTLFALMGKKSQLRLTVRRLLELRAQVKKVGNVESAEGKVLVSQIHRLLQFLEHITHAKKGEWNTILRLKDERVHKALFAAVNDAAISDFGAASAALLKELKGRVTGDILSFVSQNLVRRLMLPARATHLTDLASRMLAEKDAPTAKRVGTFRAMNALLAMSSSLCSPDVVRVLVQTLTTEVSSNVTNTSLLPLLFTGLTIASASGVKQDESHSSAVISALGRVCLQSECAVTAKKAAVLMCTAYATHSKAFTQLLKTIVSKLQAVSGGTAPLSGPVASWFAALNVIARHSDKTQVPIPETVLDEIDAVLLVAIRTAEEAKDNVDAKSKKATSVADKASASVACRIVDAAVKALTSFALHQPNATVFVPNVFERITHACAQTRSLSTGTVGACRKRLSCVKQLLKLVACCPAGVSIDFAKELTVSVLASAEDNSEVRHELQSRIAQHMNKNRGGMGLASILLLTAVSEESRAGYQRLKQLLHAQGDKLRAAQEGISLGDEKATRTYLEYCIPHLILRLSHHTFFQSERSLNFISYQRVWHLLFDELFRAGAQCASFCGEMLRRLKALDDSYAVDSTNTRVMCDLAMRVMVEALGQRQVQADTLKGYPGALLLPRAFTKPSDPTRFPADVLYLDANVQVASVPSFRAVTASMGPHLNSRSEEPQGEEVEEGEGVSHRAAASQVAERDDAVPATPPPSSRKRSRAASAHDEEEPPTVTRRSIPRADPLKEGILSALDKFFRETPLDQIAKLKWSECKDFLENALGTSLTSELRQFAKDSLRERIQANL